MFLKYFTLESLYLKSVLCHLPSIIHPTMKLTSTRQVVDALEAAGQLVRVDVEVDPRLEIAEIQRRVFRAGGPAIYFSNVHGCRFPMVSNVFGTMERMRLLFGDTIDALARLARLQVDPADIMRRPRLYLNSPLHAWHSRPKQVRRAAVFAHETNIGELPQLVSWPEDGGPYITLPQVYSENPDSPGLMHSNLGMYRVQLGGGQYRPGREVGLHYQIHRGIGTHHAAAIRRNERLPVNVFVGGTPAMTVAAVMPLPEGISELTFAGVLAGGRIPLAFDPQKSPHGLPVYADADFCLCGYIEPDRLLPEGPFGDHLGYYSLAHDFPVMTVERVYHRADAVWPFTVVGRPPQEDAMFARLIHEIVGPVIEKTLPGVRAVHAVEAAGVHPLLLVLGSERYVPYEKDRRPRELLTQANAVLGQGQLSLAKYLFIAAAEDDESLDVYRVKDFLRHVLERVDWRRDLHFQTCTTIDTLDYSGTALNEGSKLVIAAAGPLLRKLPTTIDDRLRLPEGLGLGRPWVGMAGVLVVEGAAYTSDGDAVARFVESLSPRDAINEFPLIIVADDSAAAARSLDDLLWTTFTRSNPARDVYGIGSFTEDKHWGARGSLAIDARRKPHHAPPLVEDPEVTRRVDALAAKIGPLKGII